MKIIGANITGSFILNNQDVTNTLQSSSVWSGSVAAEINSLNAASASLNSATASLNSATASLYAATASLNSATASLNTFTASAATTGSNTFNGNQIVSGSLTVTGSITTPGTLTAQTLIVQTITSSQDFVTGSTKFGSIISNTHQFTGSISVSGALAVNDSNVILTNQTSSMSVATASFVANAQTASYVENAQTASFVTTAQTASFVTLAQTASFVANAQSASNAVNAQTASLAQTASYVENAQTASFVTTAQTASFVTTAQTASFVANAQSASNAVNATTASSADTFNTRGNTTIGNDSSSLLVVNSLINSNFFPAGDGTYNLGNNYGQQWNNVYANTYYGSLAGNATSATTAATASSADNLTVRNTLTAQTLVVQTITSSVDFVTGSTQFGTLLSNTHVFSGSVTMNPGGLFVSSSGNIGIGTTNPSLATLQISGSDTGFRIQATSRAQIVLQTASGSWQIESPFSTSNVQSGSLGIIEGGVGTRLTIQRNTGNVGIGTTSLSEKLTVSGSIALVGNYSIKSDFEGVTFLQHTLNDSNFWAWQEQSAGWGYFVGNRNAQLNSLGGIMAGSGLGSFLTNSSSGWSLALLSGSLSSYATIAFDHNFGRAYFRSNVGIGTTSPSTLLHIASGSNPYIRIDDTGVASEGGLIMQPTGYNPKGGLTLNFANGELKLFTGETGNGYFQTFYTNGVERIRITTDGKVGIGTTDLSGTAKFLVNGNIGFAGDTEKYLYMPDIGQGTGSIYMQAGFGSAAAGGAVRVNGHNASSNGGGVDIGLSSNKGSMRIQSAIGATTHITMNGSGIKLPFGDDYLNYYDEGTWTPIFTFDSGSPYTGTTLRYIRIGKLLFLHGQTGLDTSGRSGGITVTNLPFTLETGTGQGSNDCYLAIWGLNDNCYSYGYPSYSLNSTSLSLYVHGGPSLGSSRYFPLTVANCNLSTVYVSFMNTFVCA